MAAIKLVVTRDVEEAIRRHGQETYPHECCGALIGTRDDAGGETEARAVHIVMLPNTTEEGPRRRFLVRASDYRLAERRASERGGELLGFYHSHPDHPARPSQYDLDHAWPTFAYIIVSVRGVPHQSADPSEGPMVGAAAEMTVWFLKNDRSSFEEGILHHGENPHSDSAAAVHR